MDKDDQQAIEGLFGKLAEVEQQSAPRDAESEAFILERIAYQPGAPYYMAQTIVVQQQALEAAQARIEELEVQSSKSHRQAGFSAVCSVTTVRQPDLALYRKSAVKPKPHHSNRFRQPTTHGEAGEASLRGPPRLR